VDLLYISQGLPGCCLKPEATDRIERRLKELCSVASKSCVGISGNNRVKKLKQVKKLAIHRHEVEDPNELPRRIASLEEEKAKLQEQVDSLEAKCESLVEEVLEFTQDRRRITELEQSVENVNDENEALQAYTVYKPFWKETVANTVIPLMQTKGLLMIVSVKPKSKGN
jgi:predicted RNase H-like nuclease (RuvC/YqgF family)